MTSTVATAPSMARKKYKRGYTNGGFPRGNASPWQRRGPTRNKKAPKAKAPHHRHIPVPPSSPSGSLLERIGGSVDDEAGADRIDGEMSSDSEHGALNLPLSATPHFYTPEPDEVDRFLESVMGASPAVPSPPGAAPACLANKPSLALETHTLPVKVEDTSSAVFYSPTQIAVNSLPSASLARDQNSLLGDVMSPPSASTIEACRQFLVPVLLAATQARDPARHVDAEQCLGLLSDDHCHTFIRKAHEMRRQLASLLSQKTPVYQGQDRSLKRDRTDEVDAWVQHTRTRFDSVNSVVSDVSRRDSDITLADGTGSSSPPRAPRAMRHAFQLNDPESAQDGAPYQTLGASPTPASATSLIELVYQALHMFPALVATTGQPVAEMDITMASAVERPGHPMHALSPTQPAPSSAAADFVAHLPTEPGIWFKHQGKRFSEIVNVEIDVSPDMFHLCKARQPSRLRMPLRLCAVPADHHHEGNDAPEVHHDPIKDAIARHALQWPKKGTLIIQVNPDSERHKTWLPHALASDAVDVTSCVQPGKNVFRFIQLADLSEFHFVLVASPPPPEEAWRDWDWASVVDARASTTTDDPAGALSEFAHIPVVVRS